MLLWLKIYLCRRPQGSELWPLLFLVCIINIAKNTAYLTRLFADDSSLFYAVANIADKAGVINHDLQLLSNWARKWLVTFSALKTDVV